MSDERQKLARLEAGVAQGSRCVVAAVLAASIAGGCDKSGAPQVVAIGYAALEGRTDDSVAFDGVQLAIDALNSEVDPKRFRFVARRPSSARGNPVRAAAELRNDPDVAGIVGNLWSQEMLDAAAEYSAEGGGRRPPIVAIAPVATNHDLSGISRWVFRLAPTDSEQAVVAAQFMLDSLRVKRPAVLFRNDAYGRDWSKALEGEFRRRGQRVASAEPFMDRPEEWALYAAFVKRRNPDALVLPAMDLRTLRFLQLLRAEGISVPVVSGDAGWGLAAGADLPTTHAIYYAEIFSSQSPPGAEGRRFVDAYRERFPRRPGMQVPAFAFDAAYAIGKAVMAVGPDRSRIREFLESLGRSRDALAGVAGPIAFDDKNDATRRIIQMRQVKP